MIKRILLALSGTKTTHTAIDLAQVHAVSLTGISFRSRIGDDQLHPVALELMRSSTVPLLLSH